MSTPHIKPFFECPHCCKKLTTEARLAKHTCEAKKRHDFLQTPKGKGAFYCYKTWLNLQGKTVKDVEVFQNSKYYNSIMGFIKFCNSVGIPDRKHYIKFMIEKGLLPSQWDKVDVYDEYLQHFDESKTPMEMVRISMDTIYDLADIFECETNEILQHMYTSDILKLVTARKLSPWILLMSKSFREHVKHDTTHEQRILINAVINHKHWAAKFADDPDTVAEIREVLTELDF